MTTATAPKPTNDEMKPSSMNPWDRCPGGIRAIHNAHPDNMGPNELAAFVKKERNGQWTIQLSRQVEEVVRIEMHGKDAAEAIENAVELLRLDKLTNQPLIDWSKAYRVGPGVSAPVTALIDVESMLEF